MTTRNIEDLRKEVAAHIKADALVRSQYWSDGKGCFIGCLTHSEFGNTDIAVERFGLTEPLLRIAENIFEGLPDDEGRAFFAALPDAVERDGKDLSRVHWAFLASELRALPPTPQEMQAVIDPVIAGMDMLASGGGWPMADACSAAGAAADAVPSAAAYYAARATHADAHTAARAAAYAAYAVARAAAYAADAAAGAAARLRQRDILLRLIKEAE